MAPLVLGLSAFGLVVLGWRVVSVANAQTWETRWPAIKRCALDWFLSMCLAFIGGMTGGVMGGAAGLIAGPVVSLLVGKPRKTTEDKYDEKFIHETETHNHQPDSSRNRKRSWWNHGRNSKHPRKHVGGCTEWLLKRS